MISGTLDMFGAAQKSLHDFNGSFGVGEAIKSTNYSFLMCGS
jgi:hypothetical protein